MNKEKGETVMNVELFNSFLISPFDCVNQPFMKKATEKHERLI